MDLQADSRPQPHHQSTKGYTQDAREFRVTTERDNLEFKLRDISQLIDSELFDTLPKAEQGRLQRQKLIMIDYLAVLNERIAAW